MADRGDKRVNIVVGSNYTIPIIDATQATQTTQAIEQKYSVLNQHSLLINLVDQSVSLTNITLTKDRIAMIQSPHTTEESLSSLLTAAKNRIIGWKSHWSAHKIAVLAPLVIIGEIQTTKTIYSHPDIKTSTTVDELLIKGKIAVIQRGGIPIVSKVQHAQRLGAVGVLIVDNGTCKTFDQACV